MSYNELSEKKKGWYDKLFQEIKDMNRAVDFALSSFDNQTKWNSTRNLWAGRLKQRSPVCVAFKQKDDSLLVLHSAQTAVDNTEGINTRNSGFSSWLSWLINDTTSTRLVTSVDWKRVLDECRNGKYKSKAKPRPKEMPQYIPESATGSYLQIKADIKPEQEKRPQQTSSNGRWSSPLGVFRSDYQERAKVEQRGRKSFARFKEVAVIVDCPEKTCLESAVTDGCVTLCAYGHIHHKGTFTKGSREDGVMYRAIIKQLKK